MSQVVTASPVPRPPQRLLPRDRVTIQKHPTKALIGQLGTVKSLTVSENYLVSLDVPYQVAGGPEIRQLALPRGQLSFVERPKPIDPDPVKVREAQIAAQGFVPDLAEPEFGEGIGESEKKESTGGITE